jgi:hypothetical protein
MLSLDQFLAALRCGRVQDKLRRVRRRSPVHKANCMSEMGAVLILYQESGIEAM